MHIVKRLSGLPKQIPFGKSFGEVGLSEKISVKLIEIIRNISFGEVRVVVTDGVPTRVEEIKKSIKL